MKTANYHPEGSTHPRHPRTITGLKHPQTKKFSNIIREKFALAKELFPYATIESVIFEKTLRQQYTNFAHQWLQNNSPRGSKREAQWIIIGAGPHAALAHRELQLFIPPEDILILEKTNTISSSMQQLSSQLILNSPTYTKVGINSNHIPDGEIQLIDFDELQEHPFPRAIHLHQLTSLMFYHQSAHIDFSCEVFHIEQDKLGITVTTNKGSFLAKNILIATGPGNPRKMDGNFTLSAHEWIIQGQNSSRHRQTIKGKTIAVIGAGDYANNVMETLLPLVYPHQYYDLENDPKSLPEKIFWIGQPANNIQDFYMKNKSRYCHSGALIEYFWGEETPFELSTKVWNDTRTLIELKKHKAIKVEAKGNKKVLTLENEEKITVDIAIEATGMIDPFKKLFPICDRQTVFGNICFEGGHWDEQLELFTLEHAIYENIPIAQKVRDLPIYFLGLTNDLDNLIGDSEARNGALEFYDHKKTLSNSKWSLEHTLPRTKALIKQLHQS